MTWTLAAAPTGAHQDDVRLAEEAMVNEAAAAAVFEAHRREVYRLARAVTRDDETARDVVQDTFVKVFRFLHRYHGNSSLRTWICAIAIRTAIDERRKLTRSLRASLPHREPSHDPRRLLDGALALRRVHEVADTLEGQQGLILRLRLLGGLDNHEVAEALGLQEPNVRMQLSKAIRRLREKL